MSFENIIGNDKVKNTLRISIKNNNIPHSYMFCGKEGIGKLLMAKEFAKAILCNVEDQKPCKQCKSCVQFESANHPDFYIIEPDGNSIKIDQIRNMNAKILEKPITSSKKVYIINDSNKMTVDAQNSLLKTLEEPPEYSVIILICHNESNMLNTIKSRCTKLDFLQLTDEELEKYFSLEKEEIPKDIIKLAEGSILRLSNIMPQRENYIKIKQLLERIEQIDKLEVLNQEYIYQDKENIQEVLEIMNNILFQIAKEKTSYINCIFKVEEAKRNLKNNGNFDMCIDNLLLGIWEEINETNCRS